jgi:hypothetical protein
MLIMKTFVPRMLRLLTTVKYRSFCFFSIVSIFGSIVCYGNAQAEEKPTQYEITPYLWAASLNGTTAAQGEESPPVDSDYSFFSLDNLDGVFSTTFSARGQQWGFLFDYLYVAFEDTFLEGSRVQTTTRLEGRITEFAGTYRPTSLEGLDIVAGLRHQDIDVGLTVANKNYDGSADWIDPFVGVIYALPLSNGFYMALRGDVGGGRSDLAINAQAMFRYQFNKNISAKLGYRYLKVQFTETNFIYDLSVDGFLLGLGIHF